MKKEKVALLQIRVEGKANKTVKKAKGPPPKKLGAFLGVYVPSMLGAFGVIVFERMGWLTAQAGVLQVLFMFIVGYTVTLLTVFSLAAIATNGTMKGGGTYYLISRVLGPEFGGSIGVMFFAANVTGAGFYVIGFGEILVYAIQGLPNSRWWVVGYDTIALALLILICFVGAKFYSRTSFFIFIIVLTTLLYVSICFWTRVYFGDLPSGYTGPSWETFKSNLDPHYTPTEGVDYNFRLIFSLVFPAITGLIAGSNMSGDLADPGGAIPKGTIWAAISTFAIYCGLILSSAATMTTHELLGNYFVFVSVSFYGRAIVCTGIIFSVLASGLACLIGGARVLQAIGNDELIWILRPFAQGSGRDNEPRYAVLLSWILCQLVVIFGSINVIAPFVTMFYMLSFLSTNFACFVLSVTGSPNFRPSFKYFHWSTALVGALMSAFIMFYTDPIIASVSLLLVIGLFFWIHFRAPPQAWGDVTQALMYHQVRKYLLRLDSRKEHIKFWHPNVLLLMNDPRNSMEFLLFLNSLKKGGLLVLSTVLIGKWKQKAPLIMKLNGLMLDFIEATKIKAFAEIVVAKTVHKGYRNLILISGIGGMKPNTLAMGFYHQSHGTLNPTFDPKVEKTLEAIQELKSEVEKESINIFSYVRIIKDSILLKKNVLISRHFQNYSSSPAKMNIDCWLGSRRSRANELSAGESTILLLGSIIQRRSKKDKLRVFSLVEAYDDMEAEQHLLRGILAKYRIDGSVEVHVQEAGSLKRQSANMNSILKKHSFDSRVIFLPLPMPPEDSTLFQDYINELDALTANLRPTLLVHGMSVVLTNEL